MSQQGTTSRFRGNNNGRQSNNSNNNQDSNNNQRRGGGTGSTGTTGSGSNRRNRGGNSSTSGRYKGKTEGLENDIIDCSSHRSAEQYTKAKKAIIEYVEREFKQGNDAGRSLRDGQRVTYDLPDDPDVNASRTEIKVWETRIDQALKKEEQLEVNLKKSYAVIWGQCTELLKARIRSDTNYTAVNDAYDAIGLFEIINRIVHRFESQKYGAQAMYLSYAKFFNFKQEDLNNETYLERFNEHVDVIRSYGGDFNMMSYMYDEDYLAMTVDKRAAYIQDPENVQEISTRLDNSFLATAFICKANIEKFGKLREDLENDYTKGNNNWPQTVTEAYSLITNYRDFSKSRTKKIVKASTGVSFAQQQQGRNNNNNNNNNRLSNAEWLAQQECYNCNKKGHLARDCPDPPKRRRGAVNNQIQQNENGNNNADGDDNNDNNDDTNDSNDDNDSPERTTPGGSGRSRRSQ